MAKDLYAAINTALQRAGAEVSAAEAQGVLCGFLCASLDSNSNAWIASLLPAIEDGDVLAQQTQQLLIKLQGFYREQLNSSDFQFALLLPDDEQALQQRLIELTRWCDGFTLGLSVGGLSQQRSFALSQESQEFLTDVLKFSDLETELAENEEHETAYMELVEYLKVGILTLYEDCHPAQILPALGIQ